MNHIIYFLGFVFLRDAVKPWIPLFRNTQLLLEWALTSSVLILIVLAVRWLLRNRLSARLRYALWGVVLLRLLVPLQIQLPAPVSDSLPLTVSNLAPEPPASWDERDIPVFSGGEQPIEEMDFEYQTFQPGYLGPGPWSDGCIGLSEDGKTVTSYADIFTRNEVIQSVWWVGVLTMAAVLLVSNLRFFLRLEDRRKRLEDAAAPIPVYVVEGLPSPCLFGVFRPAVYVTPEAAENPDTLRHVLAHELTHYAHKDHLWSLLRCLALALHWYNPLVWLAVWLSKKDGELACDEGAVARLGEDERIPYGRTLVDMVAKRSLRPADLLSCSTAMTGGKKSIQQRIAQLVKKPETVKAALFAAIAVVALSAVFVFAERGPAQRKDEMLSDFLDCLDRAAAIRYIPSFHSGKLYLDPIQKEDLLAEAKEALSHFRYLEDGDPQPDLSDKALLYESRIILLSEENEDGGPNWSLLWQNDYTYLFPGSVWGQAIVLREREGETAQLQEVSGTCISKRGDNVIATLERLAGGQSRLYMDPMPMTQEELEGWTRSVLREQNIQLQGRPEGSGNVEFHAGYTSEKSGEVDLWYYGDDTHDGVWVLTLANPALMSAPGQYSVLSDEPMVVHNFPKDPHDQEERPDYQALSAAAFAAGFRPKDTASVSRASAEKGYLPAYGDIELYELRGQLTQAMYHQIKDTYSQEKYGLYAVTIWVTLEDGTNYRINWTTDENGHKYPVQSYEGRSLTLSIGQAEDMVCLTKGNYGDDYVMGSRILIYSPEIYRTVLGCFEGAPELIQLTPEQVAQVNEAFRPDVQRPDGSIGPSEISCFFTSSYINPHQIDLEEFLRYCPLAEEVTKEQSPEEYRDVLEASFWAEEVSDLDDFLLPVPMHRYPREKVNALLGKYTWTAVEHLDQSNCLYLEKYDAFYNFTSDYGPGFFPCEGGEMFGDSVHLWSQADENGDRCELRLVKVKGQWMIQAHYTIYER